MRVISHEDPELKPFEEVIAGYTGIARALGIAYWLFLEETKPIGLVMIGKEPVRLLAPIGTPVARISIIDFENPAKVLDTFVSEAQTLATKNNVELVSTSLPAKQEELASKLRDLGFEEIANSYSMVCPLNRSFEPSGELVIERVKRAELGEFLKNIIECMSGSPDRMLNIVFNNIREMPEKFLDIWYNLEQLFWAYKDGKPIGILDLNLGDKYINNVGVSPKHRGKGYGRQITLFGLKTLMKEGGKHAGLRVHIDNMAAIGLYESLGFKVTEQNKTFLWQKG